MNVARLSTADLDQMAIDLHREAEGDAFDFGAYAPDPDADYRRGFADGVASARNADHALTWQDRQRPRHLDTLIAFGFAVLIVGIFAAGSFQ